MSFLAQFPGIGRPHLTEVCVALHKALTELRDEHNQTMDDLQHAPQDDSLRVKEVMLREEVDLVETRLSRVVSMIRTLPVTDPNDLLAMMRFELYLYPGHGPSADHVAYLSQCFIQVFGSMQSDAAPAAENNGLESR